MAFKITKICVNVTAEFKCYNPPSTVLWQRNTSQGFQKDPNNIRLNTMSKDRWTPDTPHLSLPMFIVMHFVKFIAQWGMIATLDDQS